MRRLLLSFCVGNAYFSLAVRAFGYRAAWAFIYGYESMTEDKLPPHRPPRAAQAADQHGGKPIEYDPSDPIHRDQMHKLKNWTYASYACMECGNDCDRTEEVDAGYGGPFELWCYCERCDVETFHPRVRT